MPAFAAMSRGEPRSSRRMMAWQTRKGRTMTNWSREAVRFGTGSFGIFLVSLILFGAQLVSDGAVPLA